MKKNIFLFLLCLFLSCNLFARQITVSVGAGENWKAKRNPQFVIWLEDSQGKYIQTLYITERAGKSSWIFSPKNGRPESLPVWYHSSKFDSSKTKKKTKTDDERKIDAVTSATPKGGIIFSCQIPDESCFIRAEFNNSYDYNDNYTKKNSGVNGQPSVVYSAQIKEGEKEEVVLNFDGCGSVNGADGLIYKNIENITTAKNIVKIITVTFSMSE